MGNNGGGDDSSETGAPGNGDSDETGLMSGTLRMGDRLVLFVDPSRDACSQSDLDAITTKIEEHLPGVKVLVLDGFRDHMVYRTDMGAWVGGAMQGQADAFLREEEPTGLIPSRSQLSEEDREELREKWKDVTLEPAVVLDGDEPIPDRGGNRWRMFTVKGCGAAFDHPGGTVPCARINGHDGPHAGQHVSGSGTITWNSPDVCQRVERCSAEYEREGGRQRGDRIVRCHLQNGHEGEHEEALSDVTWQST